MNSNSLAQIYYNPEHPAGYSGATSLINSAKVNISENAVKEWLQTQDTYTLHKPVRKRFPRNRYVVFTINELWQCDLNDMRGLTKYNNGYNYILTVIDVFSKIAYARVMKRKSPSCVIKAFQSIFREANTVPKNLQSDKGTEFTGKSVRQFFAENNINYFTTKNPDVKAAVIERFNRTLKTRMWRYLTHKNTHTYIHVLPKLMIAYNNSKHRSIKMAPNEVNKGNSFQVWMSLYGSEIKKKIKIPKLKVGDCVRISKNKGTFEKGYETNWSEEIFTISEIKPFPEPLYVLEDLNGETIDGMFYENELQKVSVTAGRTYKVDKILGTKGRGVSKEYLIKWYGYSDAFNSWIPAADLTRFTS